MDFSAFSLSPSKGLRLIDSLAHPYVFIRVRPRAWIRMQSGRHFHKRMYLACSFARQPGRKNVDAIKSLGEEGCTIVSRWMAAIMFRSRPVINRKIISPDYKFFSIFWYGFKWRMFFFIFTPVLLLLLQVMSFGIRKEVFFSFDSRNDWCWKKGQCFEINKRIEFFICE